MPSRNAVKVNAPGNYYQLYADGAGGRFVYTDETDYRFFLSLLGKYLLKNGSVEVLAYCLEPDHFNLLLCQIEKGGVAKLMHEIIIGYNRYFYDKYRVEDLLSESDYEISMVLPDNLLDISRDIHIKPNEWIDYPHSSLRAYFYDDVPGWLNKTRVAELYGSAVKYLEFLEDYKKLPSVAISN
jgi:REP element-mobilizing transposase RayT